MVFRWFQRYDDGEPPDWLQVPDLWRGQWNEMVTPVELWPNKTDIENMSKEEHTERDDFWLSLFVVFIVGNAVVLEIMRFVRMQIVRQRANSHERLLNSSEGQTLVLRGGDEDVDPVAEQLHSPADEDSHEVFIMYHLWYQFLCLAVSRFALVSGRLDVHTGLAWELYCVPLATIMLVHWASAITVLSSGQAIVPSFAPRVILSYIPGFSEKIDLLRDCIITCIYASFGSRLGWTLAMGSLVSMAVPTVIIYRNKRLMAALKAAHWDLMQVPDSSAPLVPTKRVWWFSPDSVILSTFLVQLEAATSELKRSLSLYEDFPQALLGIFFTLFHEGGSSVVMFTVLLTTIRLIFVSTSRPFVLCLMAKAGMPLTKMSARDISSALTCRFFALSLRVAAARDLLAADTLETGAATVVVSALCSVGHSHPSGQAVQAFAKRLARLRDPSQSVSTKANMAISLHDDAMQDGVFAILAVWVLAVTMGQHNYSTKDGKRVVQACTSTLQTCLASVKASMEDPVVHAMAEPVYKASVLQLSTALLDEDKASTVLVSEAISCIGAAGPHLFPDYMKMTKETDPVVRQAGVHALIGTGTHGALHDLVELLKDEDIHVREVALLGMGASGPKAKAVLPQLVPLLHDESSEIRATAADTIGMIGVDGSVAVPALTELLQDVNFSVRRSAAEAIGSLGVGAKESVPELVKLLRDGKWDVRRAAGEAIASMGAEGAPAVPAIIEILQGDVKDHYRNALEALVPIGDAAADAIAPLRTLLSQDDPEIRRGAVEALGAIGHVRHVGDITPLLADGNPRVRQEALQAIRGVYAQQKPGKTPLFAVKHDLMEAVVALLKDASEPVRVAAVEVIALFGADALQALPDLITLLRDESGRVHSAAAYAIGKIGDEAVPVIPDLLVLLESPKDDFRHAAVLAFGCLGLSKGSGAVLHHLAPLVEDPQALIRGTAKQAIFDLQGCNGTSTSISPDSFLRDFKEAMRDSNPSCRESAAEALGSMGESAEDGLPDLIALFKDDPQDTVRIAAVRAVGRMGVKADSALPELIQVMRRSSGSERQAAKRAIRAIREKFV